MLHNLGWHDKGPRHANICDAVYAAAPWPRVQEESAAKALLRLQHSDPRCSAAFAPDGAPVVSEVASGCTIPLTRSASTSPRHGCELSARSWSAAHTSPRYAPGLLLASGSMAAALVMTHEGPEVAPECSAGSDETQRLQLGARGTGRRCDSDPHHETNTRRQVRLWAVSTALVTSATNAAS
jgi:hypothetical protein